MARGWWEDKSHLCMQQLPSHKLILLCVNETHQSHIQGGLIPARNLSHCFWTSVSYL